MLNETPAIASPEHTSFSGGKGVADLEMALRVLSERRSWDVQTPLPTTRELGERYGISNASVCRLLKRLDDEKVIWRRENGRYYLNESRRLFEKRKPYACLLRKLQNWSRIYQGVMSGFSQVFGRDRASMLFVHNEGLVRHSDTDHPPVHAGAQAQREALAEFFRDHQDQFGGILLDDVWMDEVLESFAHQLGNAVIVCRPSRLPELSSVSIDFDAAAMLALGHLYARGYEDVWLAVPFTHAAPVDLMREAAVRAAALLGRPLAADRLAMVATPQDREAFVARLRGADRRTGIFCLEDNVSLILWRSLKAAGLDLPGQVGLLSGMGTGIVTERHISSVRIDYEKIGLTAGEILAGGKPRSVTLPPSLYIGETT
jgi:hypothetical protein